MWRLRCTHSISLHSNAKETTISLHHPETRAASGKHRAPTLPFVVVVQMLHFRIASILLCRLRTTKIETFENAADPVLVLKLRDCGHSLPDWSLLVP